MLLRRTCALNFVRAEYLELCLYLIEFLSRHLLPLCLLNTKLCIEQAKRQQVSAEKLDQIETQLEILRTNKVESASPTKQQIISLRTQYQNGQLGDAEKLAAANFSASPN